MAVRRKHIRDLVERLLDQHGIVGPPVPVEKIAGALGLELRRAPAEDDLSGFLYRDRHKKTAAVGVNSTHHANRQRFTIGHELGHYLLHDLEGIHVDRRFEVKLRNGKLGEATDDQEKEANLFAAELLMPERILKADLAMIEQLDLEDEASLGRLAGKYEVSVQALNFRVANLGLVTI
jgi:Zn-dependent peptidase ImmA (M78 family)